MVSKNLVASVMEGEGSQTIQESGVVLELFVLLVPHSRAERKNAACVRVVVRQGWDAEGAAGRGMRR